MANPIVTIEMENGDIMKAELYPEIAPNTVRNFISLIQKNFYDGLIFHKVIRGFMIQGGCPNGTGMGGPGYGIKGEFDMNGFTNGLKHTEGVLSMARAQHPDSAGSQFFIMHKTSPHLDGAYAAFGNLFTVTATMYQTEAEALAGFIHHIQVVMTGYSPTRVWEADIIVRRENLDSATSE